MEICDSNLMSLLDLEAILEAEYPEVAVLRNECMSFCGMCAKRPYAIVNGKRIFAKTQEECLTLIREKIEEELSIYRS